MGNTSEVMAFWAWNGDMNHQEICNQLESFKKEGFTGAFLHARAGLKLHYLEDDWFSAVECAILKAKELNLDIYFYDEDGWPSGFAGGRVQAVSEEFWSMSVEISKQLKENSIVLISYKKNNDGSYKVDPNGKDLFVLGHKSKYYVDLLNPEVVRTFIKITYDEYKKRFGQYFGNVVKGIFTDEPQLMRSYVYNRYLKEVFEDLYHENIDDNFYLLDQESFDAKQFRLKYFTAASKLFHTSFSKQIGDWCEANNIKFTGHLAAEDGLYNYPVNMGVMEHYINFQMPAIDFLGKRITSPVLMKQLESVKNQFGKPMTACEVFGGGGWEINFNTLKYIWSYNAAFGVNGLCSHFSAFSIEGIRKRDYPAFFSYQEPWFEDYNHLIATFKNLSNFTQEGKPNNDVLVISPLVSAALQKIFSDPIKNISTDYRLFVKNLLDKQVKFELTDETILANYGKVHENSISLVNSEYKVIFLPSFEVILKSTLDMLMKAKENGVKVCFVSTKPIYLYDNGKLSTLDSQILEGFDLVNNRNKLLDKYLFLIDYQRNLEIKGGFSNALVDNLVVNERKVGNDYYFLVMNVSEVDSKQCNLKINKKHLYIASPVDRKFKEVPLINGIGYLSLCPMQSIFVISSDEKRNCDLLLNDECLIHPISLTNVTRDADNVFTLDNASFKYDDGEYCKPINTVKLQDEIFKNPGKNLYVKYEFSSKIMVPNLKVSIENIDAKEILVNGKPAKEIDAYFIDKAIRTYDISDLQIIGKNEIVVRYEMQRHEIMDVESIFETERNRFFYPVVVESVYLTGDFSLNLISGDIDEQINYFSISDSAFEIDKPVKLDPTRDLTTQGLFFYRGPLTYSGTFVCDTNKAFISIPKYEGSVLKLLINDRFVSIVLDETDIDISGFVKNGTNTFKCEIICSNRNTLGPHHHKSGLSIMTGVHTFKGERGFEDDFESFNGPHSTWTDSYSFIRTRLSKPLLKKTIK